MDLLGLAAIEVCCLAWPSGAACLRPLLLCWVSALQNTFHHFSDHLSDPLSDHFSDHCSHVFSECWLDCFLHHLSDHFSYHLSDPLSDHFSHHFSYHIASQIISCIASRIMFHKLIRRFLTTGFGSVLNSHCPAAFSFSASSDQALVCAAMCSLSEYTF